MRTLALICFHCHRQSRLSWPVATRLACPACSGEITLVENERGEKEEGSLDHCAVCASRHFYRHRDFSQALGCLIMTLGIALAPFTFGLSLPVLALIDWLLYKKTKDMAVCYRCHTEYRGFDLPPHIRSFEHHLGQQFQESQKKRKGQDSHPV